ncbi:pectate lyase family protein [Vibrio salinus]|uniref:pectate lyase family protein n=1 Tax=Vibrio salinus TaxID=2899784 RepID=UPI001E4198DC|nr:polysaccharide lyase [Vibrio salinus]MCE0495039.1 polysaccharide lyase [Vibrio salinus]
MKTFSKSSINLALSLILTGIATVPVQAGSLSSNVALEIATIGYATQNGGTTGGQNATSDNIYTVSTISKLKSALTENSGEPRIIQIKGIIDVSGGTDYSSKKDQKKRSQLKVPSNTTIIGITSKSGITNGSLIIKKVENVIVRNLYVESPVDVDPEFEDGDGWNAEWDGMNIIKSSNVWVDHMTFDDGSFTDDQYTTKDGWTYVQHDGELDIKHGSDYISITNSVFKNHDKTMLIGHSASNNKEDSGHLRVTLAYNIFSKVEQRTPRVRFGKIHSYNNLFKGDYTASTYAYKASYGLGYKGSILSENNVFNIDNLSDSNVCKIVDVKKSNSTLNDEGSTLNGDSLDLSGCSKIPGNDISWSVPYSYSLRSTGSLVSYLNKNAGVGKLTL